MSPIEEFIQRHRPARYVFVAVSWPATAVADRVRGIWNPADVEDLRRALRWARTGELPGADRPRTKPARMTTPAERAPLYAAYAAARAKEQEIGYRCEDDSIIQAAVRAYESAEMARLRAQIAAAYAFADELDNDGKEPTLLAIRLRERLNAAGPPSSDEPPPRWRCNRTERCFREDGHDGPHGFAGTTSAPNATPGGER